MKTSALIALAGVVAVVAAAGLVTAANTGAQIFGTQTDSGSGSGMMNGGHMHQNQWSYQSGNYSRDGGCHDYDWNNSYNYDNDYGGCPCW